MKFRHKKTGAILMPTSKFVIEQMKAHKDAYEVVAGAAEETEMTVAQLKEKATELGIEIPRRVTKVQLLELIAETKEEDSE